MNVALSASQPAEVALAMLPPTPLVATDPESAFAAVLQSLSVLAGDSNDSDSTPVKDQPEAPAGVNQASDGKKQTKNTSGPEEEPADESKTRTGAMLPFSLAMIAPPPALPAQFGWTPVFDIEDGSTMDGAAEVKEATPAATEGGQAVSSAQKSPAQPASLTFALPVNDQALPSAARVETQPADERGTELVFAMRLVASDQTLNQALKDDEPHLAADSAAAAKKQPALAATTAAAQSDLPAEVDAGGVPPAMPQSGRAAAPRTSTQLDACPDTRPASGPARILPVATQCEGSPEKRDDQPARATAPPRSATEPEPERRSAEAEPRTTESKPQQQIQPAPHIAVSPVPEVARALPPVSDRSEHAAPRPASDVPEPTGHALPFERGMRQEPLQEIAMMINGNRNDRVALRFEQRGEEVRVSVRAADPVVSRELRAQLDQLVGRLDTAGFRSDVFRPAEPELRAPRAWDSGRGAFGDPAQGRGGQSQQQGREQRRPSRQRPYWLADFSREIEFTGARI